MSTVQNIEVEATGFKPFRKNTLRGFVDLALPAVGLVLLGCTLQEKNGSRWIGLPARPYQMTRAKPAGRRSSTT